MSCFHVPTCAWPTDLRDQRASAPAAACTPLLMPPACPPAPAEASGDFRNNPFATGDPLDPSATAPMLATELAKSAPLDPASEAEGGLGYTNGANSSAYYPSQQQQQQYPAAAAAAVAGSVAFPVAVAAAEQQGSALASQDYYRADSNNQRGGAANYQTDYQATAYQATDYQKTDYQTTDYQTTDYQTTEYGQAGYQANDYSYGQGAAADQVGGAGWVGEGMH